MNFIFKRVFIVFAILSGLAVNVFLINSASRLTSIDAATNVEIFFTPDSASLPPNAVFRFMIDPKSQSVSFFQTAIWFDPDIVQLSANPTLSTNSLSIYRPFTPLAEANTTGRMEVTLVRKPGSSPPTSIFELFTVPITYLSSAQPSSSSISVIDEQTKIVSIAGTTATDLNFTVRNARVAVNGGRLPPRGAAAPPASDAARGRCGAGFIDTAIGCVPFGSDQAMASFFLRWGLGIAGGIALILIVYSGYMVSTSYGDPRRLQAGKELLVAALSGLFLLVMGAYILRVIGVDILQIPGF